MPDNKSVNPLLAAIARAAATEAVDATVTSTGGSRSEAAPAEGNGKSRARLKREGTRLIAGHFAPEVARQLRVIAAEEDTTIQALLGEALDLLFVKKGRPRIARQR